MWERSDSRKAKLMAVERFYIHRRGETESCALTRTKDEPRLPTAPPPPWRFWMQVTRHQVEDGRYGFIFDAAVVKIQSDGFFLFNGSPNLLGHRTSSGSDQGEPSNV